MIRGTTIRSVRVSDDLWAAAQAAAQRRGMTVSAFIVQALTQLVANDKLDFPPGQTGTN